MIPMIGAVAVTTKCNFLCDHCSVRNSPYGKYNISKEVISKFIDALAKIPSVRVVVFTGGEPTLFMDELLYGIEYAHKKGFVTRLVTNGWFARSYDEALRYVKMFKSHGLDEINTSYDDFHAKFASIDNIANLIKASLEEGLRVAVGVASIKGSYYTADRVKEELSKRLGLSIDELEKKVFFIEDQPTPVGGASLLYSREKDRFEQNRSKLDLGCVNIGRALALMPNGDVKICCGHPVFQYMDDPFLLGNIMDKDLVEMIKQAQSKLFYWWLHFTGPKRILEKVGIKGEYATLCHACDAIIRDREYRKKILNYMETHKYEILINDILMSDNIVRIEEIIRSAGLMDKLKKIFLENT